MMFALLGFRYHVMDEVTKLKRRIDFLLDRYNSVPVNKRPEIEKQLRVATKKLKGCTNG